jgi:hypothetical protein
LLAPSRTVSTHRPLRLPPAVPAWAIVSLPFGQVLSVESAGYRGRASVRRCRYLYLTVFCPALFLKSPLSASSSLPVPSSVQFTLEGYPVCVRFLFRALPHSRRPFTSLLIPAHSEIPQLGHKLTSVCRTSPTYSLTLPNRHEEPEVASPHRELLDIYNTAHGGTKPSLTHPHLHLLPPTSHHRHPQTWSAVEVCLSLFSFVYPGASLPCPTLVPGYRIPFCYCCLCCALHGFTVHPSLPPSPTAHPVPPRRAADRHPGSGSYRCRHFCLGTRRRLGRQRSASSSQGSGGGSAVGSPMRILGASSCPMGMSGSLGLSGSLAFQVALSAWGGLLFFLLTAHPSRPPPAAATVHRHPGPSAPATCNLHLHRSYRGWGGGGIPPILPGLASPPGLNARRPCGPRLNGLMGHAATVDR